MSLVFNIVKKIKYEIMCMEILGKEEKVMEEEMLGLMEKKENIINGEVKLESDVKLVEIVLEKGIEMFGFI